MKSLVSKIKLSKLSLLLRNTLKIKPVDIATFNLKRKSISDAFAWRTDNGFKTIFKFSDILNIFYKIKKSKITIEFFNKDNQPIKKVNINNINFSNKLTIDKNFFNGLESYGIFYIYHQTNFKFNDNDSVSNKCYLGYSINNNLSSFVHGNTLSKFKSINFSEKIIYSDPVKMSLICNQKYKIQKHFTNYDKNEFMFCNPTNSDIHFIIEKEKYFLKKGCSKILSFKKIKTITIKSNCMFFRPTVFSYKNNFLDVHHS